MATERPTPEVHSTPMTVTRGTEERLRIRGLIFQRGWHFVSRYFASISPDVARCVYFGLPVPTEQFEKLQAEMKERLTP